MRAIARPWLIRKGYDGMFYRIIAHRVTKRVTRETQGEIDRRQDEAIETISKETKKALALEDELNAIKNRLGEPKEG